LFCAHQNCDDYLPKPIAQQPPTGASLPLGCSGALLNGTGLKENTKFQVLNLLKFTFMLLIIYNSHHKRISKRPIFRLPLEGKLSAKQTDEV
jgi:hypothetical protein